MPAHELLEGLALVIAGAFLLTPGFFTDSVGFLLLLPITRQPLIAYLSQRLVASGHVVVDGAPGQGGGPRGEGDVIDGVKYRRHDDDRDGA